MRKPAPFDHEVPMLVSTRVALGMLYGAVGGALIGLGLCLVFIGVKALVTS